MVMNYTISNPNEKIIKNLTLDFARNSGNTSGDSLTVVRETEDGYVVRITQTDEKTGGKTERTEVITREAFEAGVRCGYLKKITE